MVGIQAFPIGARPIFRGDMLVSGRVSTSSEDVKIYLKEISGKEFMIFSFQAFFLGGYFEGRIYFEVPLVRTN